MNKSPSRQRAFVSLGVASAVGYSSTLILSPVMTRLFSPEQFGLFGIFGGIVAVFSIFATMNFELAILGEQRKANALRFVQSAIALSFLLSMLSVFFCIFLDLISFSNFLPLWAFVASFVTGLIAVFQSVATNWAIRTDNHYRAARATLVSLICRSALMVLFGFFSGSLASLILGDAIGRVAGWLTAENGTLRCAFRAIRSQPAKIAKHIISNRHYVTMVTPAIAIDVSLVWLPPMIFAVLYGPVVGGLLALIQRLGSAPLTIANQSMGQLVHRFAGQQLPENRKKIVKLTLFLVCATLPALGILMLVLWFFGEALAVFAFGPGWHDAGMVAFVCAPLFYIQFLSLVTNRLMLVMNKMKLKLLASFLHLGLMFLVVTLFYVIELDWLLAMAVFSGSLVVSHLIVFIAVLFLIWHFETSVTSVAV